MHTCTYVCAHELALVSLQCVRLLRYLWCKYSPPHGLILLLPALVHRGNAQPIVWRAASLGTERWCMYMDCFLFVCVFIQTYMHVWLLKHHTWKYVNAYIHICILKHQSMWKYVLYIFYIHVQIRAMGLLNPLAEEHTLGLPARNSVISLNK